MKSVPVDEEEFIILEKLLSDAENELKRLKLVVRLTVEQQEILDKEIEKILKLRFKMLNSKDEQFKREYLGKWGIDKEEL